MRLNTATPTQRQPTRAQGWTLSELLISLALMAVLAAVALPTFQSELRQARRADAQSALQQLQLDQARWRSHQPSFASDLNRLGWRSDQSPAGHYQIAIENATANGYTLVATPIGAQAADSACTPMRLQLQHSATVVFSSGMGKAADPARCWRQ